MWISGQAVFVPPLALSRNFCGGGRIKKRKKKEEEEQKEEEEEEEEEEGGPEFFGIKACA
jgi:ribosomal protein L12E/L44/L45/RPP1/RPP2